MNFKNIETRDFSFSPSLNCLIGDNGVGKTNSLDAIYHLGMTKSYFSSSTLMNIRLGEDFYLIEGNFEKEGREETVVCSVKKGQKKNSQTQWQALRETRRSYRLLPYSDYLALGS